MKAPKILPWIAHKNGITAQFALNLWRHAAQEAKEVSGCCDSSDCFLLAMNRFIESADEEGNKRVKSSSPECPPSHFHVGSMLREQNQFWQMNRLATQQACRFWLSDLKPFLRSEIGLLNIPHFARRLALATETIIALRRLTNSRAPRARRSN